MSETSSTIESLPILSRIVDKKSNTTYQIGNYFTEYQDTLKKLEEYTKVMGYDEIPVFDEATDYLENSLVLYNNVCYRFTEYHSAGVWNGSQVSETDLYTEIQDMRGAAVEQVLVHLSLYDGVTIDWSQQEIVLTVSEEITKLNLDSNGEVSFNIQKGIYYTIDYPVIDGYEVKPSSQLKATNNYRTINLEYGISPATTAGIVKVYCYLYGNNAVRYTTNADITTAGLSAFSPVGKTITLTYTAENGSEVVNQKTIGEDLTCTFEETPVPYGLSYTVDYPPIDGTLQRPYTNKKGVSSYSIATFYLAYVIVSLDITVYDTSTIPMTEYAADTIDSLDDATKASLAKNGIIKIENSTLDAGVIDDDGNTGAGFYLKLPITVVSKQWTNANKQFDTKVLPNLSNAQAQNSDFRGILNTHYIRTVGDEMSLQTPAADYCENPEYGESSSRSDAGTSTCAPALYINNELHRSYLGSASQWHHGIKANLEAITAIQTALGLTPITFNSGVYWSSSQCDDSGSWGLRNGSLGSYGKTTSRSTVPFYDLLPIGTI